MMLPEAIILGVDTAIGLTVMRELGEYGVPVHAIAKDSWAIGGASRWAKRFSVRGLGRLTTWLPERLRSSRAKALFAISEDDLVELAQMPDTIGDTRILTPRAEPLALVLDKRRTLAIAEMIGIDVPHSWQPMAEEDFAAILPTLGYPKIAKWANPPAIVPLLEAAGIEFIKTEHLADEVAVLAMLDRYRPLGQWPLVQRFCPGHGVGQMLHMHRGHATLRFQHRRLHEWPPAGGTSTLSESLPEDAYPEQMAKSEALLAAIGWEGPAMVEYRHDPGTGKFWLMEVNGRFWGSLPLAHAAGAHFAWEQYRHAFPQATNGGPVPQRRYARARFFIPETRRMVRIMRTAEAEGRRRAFTSWLLGGLDPATSHYVWSWRDPLPLLRDLANMLLKPVRRGRRRPAP